MPGRSEAMKDVGGCDKPGSGANQPLRTLDFRMGKPAPLGASFSESIGEGSERRELKHLSTCRNRTRRDSVSSGERTRNSLNRAGVIVCRRFRCGVAGLPACPAGQARSYKGLVKPKALERAVTEGESPVGESQDPPGRIPSRTGHEEPGLNPFGPPNKAKYY